MQEQNKVATNFIHPIPTKSITLFFVFSCFSTLNRAYKNSSVYSSNTFIVTLFYRASALQIN